MTTSLPCFAPTVPYREHSTASASAAASGRVEAVSAKPLAAGPGGDQGMAELSVQGLCCGRGYRRLVDDVNFAIASGQGIHIGGVNGVGKTTLLQTLATLNRPDAGALRWNGAEVWDSVARYRRAICYLGHRSGLAAHLTAQENLFFYANFAGSAASGAVVAALTATDCMEFAGQPVGQLSAGQKQRVALARVFMSACPLWILDEPANALDAPGIALLRARLQQHLATGGLLVYTSHQPLAITGCSSVVLRAEDRGLRTESREQKAED